MKKRLSISTRLSIIISTILIAILSISALVVVTYERDTLTKNIETQGQQIADFKLKTIDTELIKYGSILQTLSKEIAYGNYDKKQLQELMGVAGKAYNFNIVVYAGFKDKTFVMSDGWEPKAGYDPTIRPWYAETNDKDNVTFSSLYIDLKTNQQLFSITQVIEKNGEKLGVVGLDIDFNMIAKGFSDLNILDGGYIILFDKFQNVLLHPNKDFVGKKLQDNKDEELTNIGDLIANTTDGIIKYSLDGVDKLAIVKTSDYSSWKIVATVPSSVVYAEVNRIQTIIIICIFVIIFLIVAAILFVTKLITKPIKTIVENVSVMALGDFSKSIVESKYNDEINDIIKAIKMMQISTKDIVTSIKKDSSEVGEQSHSLSAISQEMTAATENVSSSIQDVAKGTTEQANNLSNITQILEGFSKNLDTIVFSIDEVKNNSRGINAKAMNSNEKMKLLNTSVTEVSDMFSNFNNTINGFEANINQINDITLAIKSIADQTNLLALNAAIEAARAGESGKGFAVVADEIRKLAEQSKRSSESIKNLVETIAKETGLIVNNNVLMNKELANQTASINNAIESFKEIIEDINNSGPKIEEVYKNAESINKDKAVILEKIESAAAIAEEVSASSETIASTAQQMTASAQEVSKSAEVLGYMTADMIQEVDKFKI